MNDSPSGKAAMWTFHVRRRAFRRAIVDRRRLGAWAAVLLFAAAGGGCLPQGGSTPSSVDVRFSPHGGCTDAIVAQLDAAQSSVLVQAYSFTSAPIAQALLSAHQRGLDVRVLLDKSQRSEKYTSADFLARAGVPTAIDAQHAIAHNKIMIVDGAIVLTGSFNFTKSAEQNNAENLLILHDPALAEKYTANWLAHAEHCETYTADALVRRPPREGGARPEQGKDAAGATPDADDSGEYVTSANSEVFHKAGCRAVAKIAAHNRVHYATRGEAISAGKRPCTECKP
jgi:phosphatidylserine/phosphatidylglycerophosphate/cardiolipin synthase-like enzyme